MFKDTRNEKSAMELIVTTNNPNCCPIEDNDRKYIVLKVNEIYMQKDTEYWEPFRKQIFNQECANIFYSYLLNMNTTISKWRAIDFKSLNTELKDDLNKLNKNSVEQFISDIKEQLSDIINNEDEDEKNTLIYNEQLNYKNLLNENVSYNVKWCTTQIKFNPSSFYNGYVCYCKHAGENAISLKYFGFDLKNKYNIIQIKSGNNRWYCLDL